VVSAIDTGTCFIPFESVNDCTKALNYLSNTELDEKKLMVTYAAANQLTNPFKSSSKGGRPVPPAEYYPPMHMQPGPPMHPGHHMRPPYPMYPYPYPPMPYPDRYGYIDLMKWKLERQTA
jgi:hypothetical protein